MSVKSFKTSGVGVDLAPQGLVLINTTSFSAVASQSINDVFSATYKSYKIILDHSASTALNTSIRLRVAGADNSTANYTRQLLLGNATTVTATRITAQTSWGLNAPVNNRASAEFTIINPFASLETSVHCFNNADYTGSNILVHNAYAFQATTSFTGFSIIASTGNITGQVSVYGYNE